MASQYSGACPANLLPYDYGVAVLAFPRSPNATYCVFITVEKADLKVQRSLRILVLLQSIVTVDRSIIEVVVCSTRTGMLR